MPPLSVRMVMIFVMAAAFLNFSNYTFMRFYNPPIPLKTGYNKYPKEVSSADHTRFTLNSQSWADKLLCDVNSTNNPNCKEKQNTTPVTTVYYKDMYDPDKNETPICPEMPPGLGPVVEDRSASCLETFATIYSDLSPGGIYKMSTCVSRYNVAIIVPFRGIKSSLTSFLYVLHAFLMKQQVNYQIFVVEQSNTSQPFNRGKLINVGFTEAQRGHHWDCFVFHEPNIVPADSRNLYRCGWYPRQLAIRIERLFKPPYQPKIGGAFAMTSEQFIKVNGFSNMYWGNDADYDDLYNRLHTANYIIENTLRTIGKYRTLKNVNTPARLTSQVTETMSPLYLLDGLTTLSYTLHKTELLPVYTHIQVGIDDAEESLTDPNVWNEILNQPAYNATSPQSETEIINTNVTTNVTR